MQVSDQIEVGTCLCGDEMTSREEEGDEGVRLIECLRGRLLAERQASRAAKEEAELMGKRLVELETRLREENGLRDRAEKKLNFLKKKLECFKTSPLMERSEQSIGSCQASCRLSSTASLEANEEMAPYVTHNHLLDAAEDDRHRGTGEKFGPVNSELPDSGSSSASSTSAVTTLQVAPYHIKELMNRVDRDGGKTFYSEQRHFILATSNSYYC
ncbi:uncharacterized protein LOC116208662 isoform X2 [Punica granatum]|uniref:Uncharacterized protein LOC116208662 isoform X2 n=1 Tax=Punica granatum TaxID=22663 RepID=A0A6P8DXZ6_PUNGR|nr:uncharacterized protein LOC116208662 isoform X2 [Punica granatum]